MKGTNCGGYLKAANYCGMGLSGTASGGLLRRVYAQATTGDAGYFYKVGGSVYAGYFSGNVYVYGILSATSKPFVLPQKQDPIRKIV